MKFHRSDIIKMGGTAILTSLVFIVYNLFSGSENTFDFAKSDRISWNEADALRDEYLKFKPLRVQYDDPANPGTNKIGDLEGFIINARQLDEIINHNKSPYKGGTDSTADEVIFYLGKKGKFGIPPFDKAHMHIIAAGIKSDTLLIPSSALDQTNATKSSIFDKADPCPPNCPKR